MITAGSLPAFARICSKMARSACSNEFSIATADCEDKIRSLVEFEFEQKMRLTAIQFIRGNIPFDPPDDPLLSHLHSGCVGRKLEIRLAIFGAGHFAFAKSFQRLADG